ncbi:MAG: isochorismate synthase [Candidatus Zixiibacteriota bacterium]
MGATATNHERITRATCSPDGLAAIGRALRRTGEKNADHIVITAWPLTDVVDPIRWLSSQSAYPRIYWRSRWSDDEYGGAGAAAVVRTRGPGSLHEALTKSSDLLQRIEWAGDVPSAAEPRLLGGAVFDPEASQSPRWEPFGDALFILPEALLVTCKSVSTLILAVGVAPGDTSEDVVNRLQALVDRYCPPWEYPAPPDLPGGECTTEGMPYERWQSMIDDALRLINGVDLQKVVLSRSVRWRAHGLLSPWTLMYRLRSVGDGSYGFVLQTGENAAFLSATPERLAHLSGRDVEADCIAGTVARDPDPQHDQALSRELLSSAKDRREHGYVVEGVVEILRSLCTTTDVGGEPWLMRLPTVQHLVTTARARLRDDVTYADVISQLHPTPAVGGTPRSAAMKAIRDLEPTGRGWYAGPIGWIGRDRAEFAVGIRSALVAPQQIDVFTGAGIINGSSPEREWSETDAKAQSILKIVQR